MIWHDIVLLSQRVLACALAATHEHPRTSNCTMSASKTNQGMSHLLTILQAVTSACHYHLEGTMPGQWRSRHPTRTPLHARPKDVKRAFDPIGLEHFTQGSVRWIPRDRNFCKQIKNEPGRTRNHCFGVLISLRGPFWAQRVIWVMIYWTFVAPKPP